MGLPETIRTALLAGGVNLVFGWYNVDSYKPHEFDAELPLIAAAGAKHVRLPISMDILESGTTGTVRMDRYPELVEFLTLAKRHGLVTIIDIHNTGMKVKGSTDWSTDYMSGIADAGIRERHFKLLTELARLLNVDADPNWTVLCPANEPIFTRGNGAVWYDYQKRLIPALRAVAPQMVLVSMAHDWQGIEATLWSLKTPFADDRVIVDCHMYEPMSLTHGSGEGKTWPGMYATWRSNDVPVLWDRARLADLFDELAEWRDRQGCFVHFSEVGTVVTVPESTRAAYLGDVVGIVRGHGFGYTVYDWKTAKSHNFGIKMHPQVVKAVFQSVSVPPPPVEPPPVVTGLTEAQIRSIVADEFRQQIAALAQRLVG